MLTIERRKNHPKYTTDGPLLVIKHTVDSTTIAELLRVYVASHGAQAAQGLFGDIIYGEEREKRSGPYLCFVEGGGTPRFEHTSRQAATAEAQRLAVKTGRPAHVLRSIAKVVPTTEFKIIET